MLSANESCVDSTIRCLDETSEHGGLPALRGAFVPSPGRSQNNTSRIPNSQNSIEENCGNLSSILLCNHMRSFPDDLQEVPNQTFDQERATLTGGLQAANEALTAEKDLLLQKLENLSKEMKSQGEDKRKLTEEVKILSKEKIQLIEQADALCLKNEHMKSQLEEMSADRISLTAQITTLARDKKRVVALLKGFNKEKQLSEEVDVLSREIIDLKAEVQKLTRVQTEIVGREDVLSLITEQLALLLKEKC